MLLFRRLVPALALALLLPAAAVAQQVRLCADRFVSLGPDGRLLGHLSYPQLQAAALRLSRPGFALTLPCLLQADAAAATERLLDGARADGVTGLRAVSCYRSTDRQRAVFCGRIGPRGAATSPEERARSVGPPAFSEHATGYAIDFGVRPSPGCPDLTDCIAATDPGRWLLAHAPAYGFELSFPAGNAQGVTWEPWHWRWVGESADVPGAAEARALFARARGSYPADPAVPDAAPAPIDPPAPGETLQPNSLPASSPTLRPW